MCSREAGYSTHTHAPNLSRPVTMSVDSIAVRERHSRGLFFPFTWCENREIGLIPFIENVLGEERERRS